MLIERYVQDPIQADLQRKMVFLGGPRQVGKTSLAEAIMAQQGGTLYLNYDNLKHRKQMRDELWADTDSLLVFDELHKMPKWKSWIKGIYDVQKKKHKFLVTGSARLDVYRKGGDSLLGRYHYWRMHPFTVDEFPPDLVFADALERLMTVGGFPEPFLTMDQRNADRWRKDRFDRVLHDDLRSIDFIRDINSLEVLVDMLRERVGSTLASANIARDLELSPKTVTRWIQSLETMYLIFTIQPYAAKGLARSLTKPAKAYFYDNGDVIGDRGAVFENLVATTLLKRLHWLEDYDGRRCALHYLRDKDGRECDFLTVIDKKPDLMVEVKLRDDGISGGLKYYAERIRPRRAIQLCMELNRPYSKGSIEVLDLATFVRSEPAFLKGTS